MKQIFFCIVIAALLSSCFPTRIGYVSPKVAEPKNEFVAPDFIKFLKERQDLSVILRVPTTTMSATTTQSDMASNTNAYYALIEKTLIINGIEVQDRGLLNALLSNGISDYSEIAQKTNADVIIDISITTDSAYNGKITLQKPDPEFAEYARYQIFLTYLTIDLKLIQVSNGKTGLIVTRQWGVGDHKFYYNRSLKQLGWRKDNLTYNIPGRGLAEWQKNEMVEEFSKELVGILKAK